MGKRRRRLLKSPRRGQKKSGGSPQVRPGAAYPTLSPMEGGPPDTVPPAPTAAPPPREPPPTRQEPTAPTEATEPDRPMPVMGRHPTPNFVPQRQMLRGHSREPWDEEPPLMAPWERNAAALLAVSGLGMMVFAVGTFLGMYLILGDRLLVFLPW